MKLYQWLDKRFLKNRSLQYKLNLIFCLFFLFPVMGLIYFGIRYEILDDKLIPVFFLGVLGFSLVGLYVLRKVFFEISRFSREISAKINSEFRENSARVYDDELSGLIDAFRVMDHQYTQAVEKLQIKISEIAILKDLSEICYVTSDADEILHVMLERAQKLTESAIGSVLLLEPSDRKCFEVKTCIGLDKYITAGQRITFESSIAKYAILNKTALIIEDIEKDNRFGRASRPHYGTKSFICLPIKTSRDIIGVLTLSGKAAEGIYTAEDADILMPLISNAAFTYENIWLIKNKGRVDRFLSTMANTLKIITSSFRDSELLHSFLNEIKDLIPYNAAVVLMQEDGRNDQIAVFDLIAIQPMLISKGGYLALETGSLVEKAIRQESTIIVDDTGTLRAYTDRAMFCEDDSKAVVVTPLKMDGVVKGLLAFTAPSAEAFHDAKELIEWLAKAFSLAIERNQLFAAVVKRNKELDSIKQIGSALATSTFDIRQVLSYTMDMIRMIMNVEAGALYLVKEGELEFATAFNIDVESRKKQRIKFGEGVPGYVAARGESIIVNESRTSSHFLPRVSSEDRITPRSSLCVPMISQGRVLGVIEVLNKVNGDFSSNDEDLLQSIASSVSIAIENANLYNETVSMAENERGIRRMFQKFVPKEVLDKILYGSQSGLEMVEELKTLTLLNIDLRGFSSLSKELGPQRTVSLLNHYFSVMGGIVFKHHGIVDKYLGDGFLAIFGAPVSGINDADNAVKAALEMKSSIAAVNKSVKEDLDISLTIGISIHTGEVVVGNIGFEMKMDYTVIGDSVNDVFRLQDLAKPYPNCILISEKTMKAVRSRLETSEMEERLGNLRIFELRGITK